MKTKKELLKPIETNINTSLITKRTRQSGPTNIIFKDLHHVEKKS